MLKKTIKHKDVDGNDVETDAYFNLTKAEALEINIRNDLEVIGRNRNNNEIMDAFRRIMSMAYGVKTSDGKFLKVNAQGAPLFHEFASTEAYSELFMEIFTDSGKALAFIKGILPAEISEEHFGTGAQSQQADIPAHMAQHPSMQGYKRPESRREAREQEYTRTAADQDLEYQQYLREKALRQNGITPSAQVSPEVPQQDDSAHRVSDDLV